MMFEKLFEQAEIAKLKPEERRSLEKMVAMKVAKTLPSVPLKWQEHIRKIIERCLNIRSLSTFRIASVPTTKVAENLPSTPTIKLPKALPTLPNGFHWTIEGKEVLCEKDKSCLIYIPAGEFVLYNWTLEQEIYLSDYFIGKYAVTNKQFRKFMAEGGYSTKEYWSDEGWNCIQKGDAYEWKGWGKSGERISDKITEPLCWQDSPWNKDDRPVVGITWYEAEAYCKWAGLSLPNEAKWKKAASGGLYLDGDATKAKKNPLPKRMYPWGNEEIDERGIYRANYYNTPKYGEKSTCPVTEFAEGASPYGCIQMHSDVGQCMGVVFRLL